MALRCAFQAAATENDMVHLTSIELVGRIGLLSSLSFEVAQPVVGTSLPAQGPPTHADQAIDRCNRVAVCRGLDPGVCHPQDPWGAQGAGRSCRRQRVQRALAGPFAPELGAASGGRPGWYAFALLRILCRARTCPGVDCSRE